MPFYILFQELYSTITYVYYAFRGVYIHINPFVHTLQNMNSDTVVLHQGFKCTSKHTLVIKLLLLQSKFTETD